MFHPMLKFNTMGNNLVKTYPTPPSSTRSILVIDSSTISSSSTLAPSSCDYRRPRNSREAPDLYVYCSYRNWELAKKQIELNRGLDYVSTNRRFSVLHVAVENNAPVELVRMLLKKGQDPNVNETLFKQTPLHVVMKILEEGNPFLLLDLLIRTGADVNAKAKYDRTPLYFAIKHRVPERAVAYLLRSGAIPTKEVIIFAREKSRREIVTLLDKVTLMTVVCSVYRKRSRSSLQILPSELLRELSKMLFGANTSIVSQP